jgi:hypothetical protein
MVSQLGMTIVQRADLSKSNDRVRVIASACCSFVLLPTHFLIQWREDAWLAVIKLLGLIVYPFLWPLEFKTTKC